MIYSLIKDSRNFMVTEPTLPPASDPKPCPILLVEDYEANILVATIYLDGFGYLYDIARNGIEAVEKVRRGDYSLVLMDVQMPGLNGFEATQTIREFEQHLGRTAVPIIGMTAHALTRDRERCLAAGMNDYLAKPISEAELKSKIARWLRITG
jgi:CheY-like chemotaxis protein